MYDTGYSPYYIHSFEIIGGAVRVPAVKTAISEAIGGATLGQHINGDESMSFGASYIAANLSASFRVREVNLHQPIGPEVTIDIFGLEEPYSKTLFEEDSQHGITKKFGVNATDDFSFTVKQGEKTVLEGEVKGIKEIIESEEYLTNGTTPLIGMKASFSRTGIIEIKDVRAMWK